MKVARRGSRGRRKGRYYRNLKTLYIMTLGFCKDGAVGSRITDKPGVG